MLNFITCPFCSGHEAVSPEAATAIAGMIEEELRGKCTSALDTELFNILNMIIGMRERKPDIDPLLE